jgi:hypothetical protein
MNDNSNLNGMPSPLPDATSKSQEQWRDYCAQLLAEVERLKAETVDLREQRLTLTQMLPVPEYVKALTKLSMEEVLAMAKFQPSFRELVEQFAKEQGL